MSRLSRRTACLLLTGVTVAPGPLFAAPTRYRLDPANSEVGFRFTMGGALQSGSMPVARANILVVPENLASSSVDVTLDVTRARTGMLFATQAMTGPEVLDAAHFPTIRFVSTRIRLSPSGRLSDGAQITGLLTIRDVTRRVTLDADVYRPRGTAPDDLDTLTVRLVGTISRRAFGASGYPDLVADAVALDIRATIHALN